MSEKPLGNEYVTLGDYAEEKSISIKELKKFAKDGRFKTIQFLGSGWVVQRWELEEKIDNIQTEPLSDEFVTLEKYAEINNISYATLKNHIYQRRYRSAIKYGRKWYVNIKEKPKSTPNNISDECIRISEYAEQHNQNIFFIKSLVYRGLLNAYRGMDNHFYIHKDEKFIEYISLKKYAEFNQVIYYAFLNDIHNGVYASATNKTGKWYIDKNEPCKSRKKKKPAVDVDKLKEEGYISISEYADNHKKKKSDIYNLIKAGLLNFYQDSISRRIYIKQSEKLIDYIKLPEYAKLHNVTYSKVLRDVRKGIYRTAIRPKWDWYIDRNEPVAISDTYKTDEEYITLPEYAKLKNIPYQRLAMDVRHNIYKTAVKLGGRWYIKRSEYCKSYKRKRRLSK